MFRFEQERLLLRVLNKTEPIICDEEEKSTKESRKLKINNGSRSRNCSGTLLDKLGEDCQPIFKRLHPILPKQKSGFSHLLTITGRVEGLLLETS